MHTSPAPSGLHYDHNVDYSGNVSVVLPWFGEVAHGVMSVDLEKQQATVEIPFADMEALVMERLRNEIAKNLELATHGELTDLLLLRMATRA